MMFSSERRRELVMPSPVSSIVRIFASPLNLFWVDAVALTSYVGFWGALESKAISAYHF